LANDGLYAELWYKQSGFDTATAPHGPKIDVDRLVRFPLFAGLDRAVLARVSAEFGTQSFGEGQTIFRQGDAGSTFFIIARGQVAVEQRRDDGEERRIAVLIDGDHFGEIALVESTPRNATIQTLAPTILLTLERASFVRLCEEIPVLHERIANIRRDRDQRVAAADTRRTRTTGERTVPVYLSWGQRRSER
jgi:ATP-binding cassette subfamily B protein